MDEERTDPRVDTAPPTFPVTIDPTQPPGASPWTSPRPSESTDAPESPTDTDDLPPVEPAPKPPIGPVFVAPESLRWSTAHDDFAPPPPVPPAAPSRSGDEPPRRGGFRTALAGGLAGALVGALVAGGLVLAFDDNTKTVTRVETSAVTDATTASQHVVKPIVPGDISSILDAVRPAVVRIDVGSASAGGEATGTGFIIDSSGVIVTNAHVVTGFDQVAVHLADGSQLTGKVVGEDDIDDLAVVHVNGDKFPTVALGNSDSLKVGDPVVAIGNALGLSEGSGATVTTGIVSGLDRIVRVENETLFDAIQTDAAINPGNSGGPLLDMNGKVIGINSAIASPDTSNNVGFAISIDSAKQIIADLRDGKQPQIAFLGVSTESVTPDMQSEVGTDQGAVVIDVTGNSAAAKSGLKQGDVITKIGDTKITSFEQVASAIRRRQVGDHVKVEILRNGDKQTIDVTLGKRPNN